MRHIPTQTNKRAVRMNQEGKSQRKVCNQLQLEHAVSLGHSYLYVEDTDAYLLHLKSRSHVPRRAESETLFVF